MVTTKPKTKKKRNFKAKTWEERKKEIDDLTSGMAERIPKYFQSEESIKEYLDFMGKFHGYSASNGGLIESQFSGAEAVGSFAFWRAKGFGVNNGEKGIQILVPKVITYFERDGEEVQLKFANAEEKKGVASKQISTSKRTHFGVGHVFDVSQTNATLDDLPEAFPSRWLDGSVQNYETMYNALGKVADKHGIEIIEPLDELGSAKGISYVDLKKVALNPRNSELQNVKTLAHELAHAVLHTSETREGYKRQEEEFQAEMVAYTVSSYFNLDTSEYSLPYLHDWTEGKELEDQERLLKEVRDTAHDFISTIEEDLVRERDLVMDKELIGNEFAEEFIERAVEHRKFNRGRNSGLQVDHKEGTDIVIMGYRDLNSGEFIQVGDKELNVLDYEPMLDADESRRTGINASGLFNNHIRYMSNQLNGFKDELVQKGLSNGEAEKFILKEFKGMGKRLELADTRGAFGESLTDLFDDRSDLQKKVNQYRTEDEVQKDILLIEHGSLSNTENSYVSVDELKVILEKEQKGFDKSWSDKELIGHFNEEFQERFSAVDGNALDRPSVLIRWSESNEFTPNQLMPFGEANELVNELEIKGRPEMGYDKTRYIVVFPKDLDERGNLTALNMDRYDIGDGYYDDLMGQIKREVHKDRLTPEKWAALDKVVLMGMAEKEMDRPLLFVEYGSLSSTENKYVSMDELKRIVENEGDFEHLFEDMESDEEYIEFFNMMYGEVYAVIDGNTLDEPCVLIQSSALRDLDPNMIMPFGEANELMRSLERKCRVEPGYHETRYHVLFPKDMDEQDKLTILNMDRLDIGDGYYGEPMEQIKKEVHPARLSSEKWEALDKEVHNFILKEEEKKVTQSVGKNRKKVGSELER